MYYFVIFSILSFYYVFLVCGQLLGNTNLCVYSELRSARVDTLTQSPINVVSYLRCLLELLVSAVVRETVRITTKTPFQQYLAAPEDVLTS